MKTKFCWIACLLFVWTAAGFASDNREKVKGNGVVVTRTIPVEAFDRLNLGDGIESGFRFSLMNPFGTHRKHSFTCEYTQTLGDHSLQITTDENLFDFLEIGQQDGKLTIRGKEGFRIVPSRLSIRAASRALRGVNLSGCLNFLSENFQRSDYLRITVDGLGDVRLNDFKCDTLICQVEGVGNIYLTGRAGQASYSIDGIGRFYAFGCRTTDLVCEVDGIGRMEVTAEKSLEARASGIGKIRYKCTPETDVSVSSSGLARIKPAD